MKKSEIIVMVKKVQDEVGEINDHIGEISEKLHELDTEVRSIRVSDPIAKLTTRIREMEISERRIPHGEIAALKHKLDVLEAAVLPLVKTVNEMRHAIKVNIEEHVINSICRDLCDPETRVGGILVAAIADVLALHDNANCDNSPRKDGGIEEET